MSAKQAPSWADMMAEARSLIPSLDPAWTDHNPSDPGIILVELLAWLTEMLLYRLEEVPEESRAAFVSLITGEPMPAGVELEEAIGAALGQMRLRERAITPEDYLEITTRLWPTVREGYGELGRIEVHPRRNLDAADGVDAPGHQSVILVPESRQTAGSSPVTATSLAWAFSVTAPGEITIQPELPGASPLALTLTSPRGAKVLQSTTPDTLPCATFPGAATQMFSVPTFEWAPGGALTIELYLELRSLSYSGPFLSMGGDAAAGVLEITGPTSAGVFTLRYGGEDPQALSFTLRPYVGQWIHLALVAGSGGMVCYVDGHEVARSEAPCTGAPGLLKGLAISSNAQAAIADVRIWRTARSAAAIRTDRQRRLSGDEVALAAYWPLSEGAGSAIPDRVGGATAEVLGSWEQGEVPVYDPLRFTVSPADVLAGSRWQLTLSNTGEEHAAGRIHLSWPGGDASHAFTLPAAIHVPRLSRWLRPDARSVLSFDGQGSEIVVDSLDGAKLSGDLTVELWVRPATIGSKSTLVSKAQSGELDLIIDADGTLLFRYGSAGDDGSSGSQYGRSNLSLSAGRWQHVAVVRRVINDKAAIQFYIDGQRAGSLDRSLLAATPTELPLRIGNGGRGAFQGELADVRLWSRARLPAELQQLRFVSLREAQPGLVASWPLAEGEGDQILDWSGAGHRGVIEDGQWRELSQRAGDSPPGTVPGAAGAPLFSGMLTTFDRLGASTLTLTVASASGQGPLGAVLLTPEGAVAATAVGPSPVSFAHHIEEEDPTPRLGWSMAAYHLPAGRDALEVMGEVLPDLPSATRARVKEEILDPRRMLTTRHHVVSPRWVPVSITACLYLFDGANAGEVRKRAHAALRKRFHPLSGGEGGAGWPLGQGIYLSDVYAALEAVPGVDFVVGGPWPGQGEPHDPSRALTIEIEDAEARLDREDAAVIGFSVGPAELVRIGDITLATAKKRGETWYPTE